jgi:hypothetical protein
MGNSAAFFSKQHVVTARNDKIKINMAYFEINLREIC